MPSVLGPTSGEERRELMALGDPRTARDSGADEGRGQEDSRCFHLEFEDGL